MIEYKAQVLLLALKLRLSVQRWLDRRVLYQERVCLGELWGEWSTMMKQMSRCCCMPLSRRRHRWPAQGGCTNLRERIPPLGSHDLKAYVETSLLHRLNAVASESLATDREMQSSEDPWE